MLLKTTLIGLMMTFSVSAIAEIKLTEADLLGKWKIDSEALSIDGKASKELTSVWTFMNDGNMEAYSTDSNKHARVSEFRASVKYELEDGKLKKQASPGRSKYDLCVAVEKNPPKMILECNHIFFFMTKQ